MSAAWVCSLGPATVKPWQNDVDNPWMQQTVLGEHEKALTSIVQQLRETHQWVEQMGNAL